MKEQIQKALKWRAAIKTFDASKTVSDDLVEQILEAGRMAPSAYGLQPLQIVHVKDLELRKKVCEAAYGQKQVVEAAHLFVICSRVDMDEKLVDTYMQRIVEARGVSLESLKGFSDGINGDLKSQSPESLLHYSKRQAYIAFGFMLETAALLGVDAGPMEGFSHTKVDEILGLKSKNLSSTGIMVLGYRGDDKYSQMPKVRLSKQEFVIEI